MRGSSEPVRINMIETCPHITLAVKYDVHEFDEIRDHAHCADCNVKGKNLQLCLAKDCRKITCSTTSYDHSQRHHRELQNHAIYQNLVTKKLTCYICKRETMFPIGNMDLDEIYDSEDNQMDTGHPKGLQNIGNTCYMNSALQALCNIPPLRKHFTPSFYPLPIEDKKRNLSRNFQRLIEEMCDKEGPDYLVPNGILHGIRNVYPMFRGYQQHDTQEFLRCFMDQLHEELKETVPEIPYPILASQDHVIEDMDEEPEDEGRPSSGSQSEYESCDSGVSERSSLSDEGERLSIKRKLSLGSSPLPRCKLPVRPHSFRTVSSPSKLKKRPIKYRSIISDLFDGKLLSSVQCLSCNKKSTRVETFQDLSLPIPGRDHVAMLHQGNLSPQNLVTCSEIYKGKPTWVSWLWEWVKSWFYGPTVSLHDCLAAFFSADELKGDNMYSCEVCTKLRNGMKFSKVLDLPEVLCIHLKRFRHELTFPSKIANFVSFPLTDLDMSPFLHKNCQNEATSYDLSSVICHHGTANGGHYTCYAINPGTEQWYELDDHCVMPVSAETVSNAEGYVLFYKKKNERTLKIWNQFTDLMANSKAQPTFMNFYVSQQWINRFETFAEPGPIDNSDFLCSHGYVQPGKYAHVDRFVVVLGAEAWGFLYDKFSGGPACNQLRKCEICEEECNRLRKRIEYETAQYSALVNEVNENATIMYALAWSWFRQWEAFVQGTADPPGPIDNSHIATNINGFKTLKKNSDYGQFSHELWSFFKNIYGGGPELLIKQVTRGPSRASFSSGISMDRDRITVSANKAKSVESLPVNIDFSGDAKEVVRDSYSARTHSVSSDNVTIKMAAASASHRKQQSLDNVRSIRLENGNQRDESIEDNAYCPAFTPDELDSYIPFKQAKIVSDNSVKVPI